MNLTRSLRNRPFALLWSGQTASRFGDSVHAIALAWLVLQLTGSAAAMGVVLATHLVPFLVFSLAGGVAVDRLPRLRVMLASDLARMAIVGVLVALIALGSVEFWQLLVLVALFGIVEAFFYPAYTAVVPELVEPLDRPSANGLHQLSRRLARLVGPAAGATLVAAGGTAVAFALDAATYAVSAALIVLAARSWRRAPESAAPASLPVGDVLDVDSLAVVPPTVPAPASPVVAAAPRQSALADLREGIETVTADPWIWIAIVMAGVTGITLAGPIEAGLPLLVSEHLGGDVGVLGLLETAIAVGAIGAAVVLGSRSRLRRRGVLLYGAWILFALAVAAVGTPIGIVGAVGAASVAGACGAIVGLVWTNTLQDLVPPDRLGRVSSIDALGSSALEPIGYVTAGAAADALGPSTVFVGGGLLSAGILGLALLHPSVRRLD